MTEEQKETILRVIAWVHNERNSYNDMKSMRDFGIDPHKLREIYEVAKKKIKVKTPK